MKRSRIMRRGLFWSVVAVVVPLLLTGLTAWALTLNAAQHRLNSLAQIASERASVTFKQASEALKSIALTDLEPCSPASLEHMRLVAMNTFSVESIGYEEDVFACTSAGTPAASAKHWPEDFTLEDGVRVSIDVHADGESVKPMLALQYAAFNVLVDPEQFREVELDEGIRLAVGTRQGRLLGPGNPNLAHFLALVHQGPSQGLKDGFLYSLVPQGNFMVVAVLPRHELLRSLWKYQLYLLPFGALLSAGLLWLVVGAWRRQLTPLAALERAIRRREFVVHYQPIIEIASRRCIGAEALVRWQKPNGKLVGPDQFIALAEDSGMIGPITDQVIALIMHDLGSLLAADRSLHVSLNLAAADVCSGRFLPVLQGELRRADVLPAQIWLEVTERGFVDPQLARVTIEKARTAGYLVALDDFGTGYSSLQYLQQLSLDALKIDKSFVDKINTSAGTVSLVTHVIDMGRALQLQLIAEGVETEEQLNYLQAQRVEYAQGWFFAKAMPCEDFKHYYQTAPTSQLVH